LARLPEQSPASVTGTMIARCEARLVPATLKQGKAELGACLTLVSPSGLTADDRREWLAVAMQTLSGIPADLLSRGCEKARKACRFPSEIVPTIMGEVESEWRNRIRRLSEERQDSAPRLERRPEFVPREETQRIIRDAFANIESRR
jgi:hypothetical protein